MSKESKKNRNKRKGRKSPFWSAFVRNKWNGSEDYSEFVKREFRVWNNLPPKFKRINPEKVSASIAK